MAECFASPMPPIEAAVYDALSDPSEVLSEVRALIHGGSVVQGAGDPFCGAMCVSMTRSRLHELREERYLACEKTDGVRYFLAFMSDGRSYLLDRRGRAFVARMGGSRVPGGTILDGELAVHAPTGRLTFLVFDVLVSGGDCGVQRLTFLERIREAERILSDGYSPVETDTFRVCIKAFVPLELCDGSSESSRQRDQYPNDGWILTPNDRPVTFRRNHNMFKVKPEGAHTVDFSLMSGDRLAVRRVGQGRRGGLVCRGELSPEGRPEGLSEGDVLECVLVGDPSQRAEGEDAVWRFVRSRTDKSSSNDERTLEASLTNARENVTWKDVVDAASRRWSSTDSEKGRRGFAASGTRVPERDITSWM